MTQFISKLWCIYASLLKELKATTIKLHTIYLCVTANKLHLKVTPKEVCLALNDKDQLIISSKET